MTLRICDKMLGHIINCRNVIIKIYHECEGRIENFVPRIDVWHHKAGRVMTNGVPEGRIFLSHPHTNDVFFSCSPLFLFIYFSIDLFILK